METTKSCQIEMKALIDLLRKGYIDGCRDGYALRDKTEAEFELSLKRMQDLFKKGLEKYLNGGETVDMPQQIQ